VTGFVIDCISSPSIAAMRGAGVAGLTRYLSWLNRDSLHKVIHQPEFDVLLDAGFGLALNWEYAATDWLGGADAGRAQAVEAVRQAKALGYPPGAAIYGSADFDMTLAQWNAAGRGYAAAFSGGVRAGGYLPGVYGPWDVLTWCRDAGLMTRFWQAGMSTAWSGHRNANAWPGAHLRQRRQVTVGGADCDYNDILQPDWGQYQRGTFPKGTSMALAPNELDLLQQSVTVLGDAYAASVKAGDKPVLSIGAQIAALYDLLVRQHSLVQIAMDAKAAASLAPVALTDEQAKAFTDQITAQVQAGLEAIGAKLDDRFAKLEAAGATALEAASAVLAPPKT
jgi:hypothetical protein